MKPVSTPIRAHSPLSPLLAVKFPPPRPTVILHPCLKSNSPLPTQRSSNSLLLAVKFTPPRIAVILHPCWRSHSPISAQQSFFTPVGCQHHPSPPSGHLPPLLLAVKFSQPSGHPPYLLAVKLTPLRPAVILHTCRRPTSPLSAQLSSSIPAGSQPHPSQPISHLPSLLLKVNFPRILMFKGREMMKRGGEMRGWIGEREGRKRKGDGS